MSTMPDQGTQRCLDDAGKTCRRPSLSRRRESNRCHDDGKREQTPRTPKIGTHIQCTLTPWRLQPGGNLTPKLPTYSRTKILPGRLKLIRLYPCGSLGQSISFVFGARGGHFAATPQSDVVGIWSRDLGVVARLSVRQKMPFFVHL